MTAVGVFVFFGSFLQFALTNNPAWFLGEALGVALVAIGFSD